MTKTAKTHYAGKAPTQGTFVAPHMFEVKSVSDVKREVFGPVLHIVRWKSGGLTELLDQIDALGYGLTLGVHSRIDAVQAEVVDRLDAGNCYINRNMIGAVVGDYVHNAVGKLFAHLGPNPDRAAVDAIFADINKQLDIAEQVIAAKPFAAGAKFGIADVFALPSLTFAGFFLPVFGYDQPLKGRKKLTAYMAKAQIGRAHV